MIPLDELILLDTNIVLQFIFERVFLKPKGMIVVNAAGRVDLIGEHGNIMLLLLEKIKNFNGI